MLIIPAILSTYSSLKDKTLKLVFETNEPSPEQLMEIAKLSQSFGFLAFKKDAFKTEEKDLLKSLKTDFEETGKSKSQRLRGVLYRLYESKPEGHKVFDDYYNSKMEQLINHFKDKID